MSEVGQCQTCQSNSYRNIDRLFAIWQALNPRAYEIDKEEIDGTFSVAGGTMGDQNTPLAPFNDAGGREYWTSSTTRTTEVFSYAYPETQRWRYRSYADYVNNLQATMDQLYGGVSRIFRRTGFSGRGEGLRDNERSASKKHSRRYR